MMSEPCEVSRDASMRMVDARELFPFRGYRGFRTKGLEKPYPQWDSAHTTREWPWQLVRRVNRETPAGSLFPWTRRLVVPSLRANHRV